MRKTGQILAGFFLLVLMAWSVSAQAANPMCDDVLWTQMSERARLHGQMDVSTMENMVYKADSILEYTCFDRVAVAANAHASYHSTPGFVNGSLLPMVSAWINNNYGHSSMGGRATPELVFAPATGTDYTCNQMQVVWDAAKCMNIGALSPQDNMMGILEFLNAPDSRQLPAACTGPDKTAFGTVPTSTTTPGDPIEIGGLALMPDCGVAIPTGHLVDLGTVNMENNKAFPAVADNRYYEKICTNPACTYVPTGLNTGNCTPPQ